MNFRIYIKKRLLDGTWSDTLCIQDSFLGLKETMLIDPKLTKKKNSAGSFEAGVHQDNVAMATLDRDGRPWIEKGNTRIFIKAFKNKYESPILESADGIVIWDGRVLSCDTDFYNQPKIYAEGSLSYLNDTIQPKEVFQYNEQYYKYPWQIFNRIIRNHNSICTGKAYTESSSAYNATMDSSLLPDTSCHDRTFADQGFNYQYGKEWPTDWVKEQKAEATENASKFSVGEETTMAALTKFLQTFGGSVRVTWEWISPEGAAPRYVRNLEWITEDYDVSKQNDPATISFAVNLLDMTRKTDASSVVTAVMPRGYKAYSGGSWAIGDNMFAPEEEMWPNGRDARDEGEFEPKPRIVSKTTWTSGCYIVKDSFAGAKYVWAPPQEGGSGGGQKEQTMATGYLDSESAYSGDYEQYLAQFRLDDLSPLDMAPPFGTGRGMRGRSIKVEFGEVYYISLEQSDGRVTYVVTAGPLGTNGSIVTDIGTASNGYWPSGQNGQEITKWDHNEVTIRKPSGKFKYPDGTVVDYEDVLKDKTLYLNISSRGLYYNWDTDEDYVTQNNWKGLPEPPNPYGYHRGDDPYNLGPAGIWKGRKVLDGLDEYITLKGLGDGKYSSYFYTVTTTTTSSSGAQTSTSKKIVIDCPSQVGKDRDVIEYPRYDNRIKPETYQSVDDLPTDVLSDNKKYPSSSLYDSEKKVWKMWAIVGNQSGGKKYVVVETASGFRRWYEVRTFARSGYFVYDVDAIKRYGRIEKVIDFQDAHNPDYLEEAALQYLYNAKFEEYTLDLTAIDAQILTEDSDLERVLDVMDPVKTYSTFHGVSVMLPIEEIEFPFNDLGSMSFTLSFSTSQRITSNITVKKR